MFVHITDYSQEAADNSHELQATDNELHTTCTELQTCNNELHTAEAILQQSDSDSHTTHSSFA